MSPEEVRLPRLLTIMGSGETAPTMVKVHRRVTEQLAAATRAAVQAGTGAGAGADSDPAPVHGLLLDTPFGFQTNASELAARAASYFRESVGTVLEVAGIRSGADLSGEQGQEVIARMAALPLVFSGPGSPSYALNQWKGTLLPSVLSEKLTIGGAVTFASAAALTLGSHTVPVYEVYKVGENPHWLEGLDLLRALGLPAVLIPHYDNAEGQTHDTRYSYLGEERLSSMERELPEETFVLGVDEHTAVCFDFDAANATVIGHGGATVRVRGHSTRIEAGETVPLERLLELASELASLPARGVTTTGRCTTGSATTNGAGEDGTAHPVSTIARATSTRETSGPGKFEPTGSLARPEGSPLLHAIRAHESAFRSASARSDAPGMVSAVLGLEQELWAWRADTLQSDEMDRGRVSLRAMIRDLGRLSEVGARDPAELIGPFVDELLILRDSARREQRFTEADSVREHLELLGVAVHDTAEGSKWEMRRSGSARN
jgi:cyanophycinase-like exopeptidase